MDTTVDGSEIRRSPPGMVLQPYDFHYRSAVGFQPSTVGEIPQNFLIHFHCLFDTFDPPL